MRVLQVVTDTDRRGAQVFATDLQGAFEGLGLQVRTVALAPGVHGELDLPTLGPVRLHPGGLARLRRLMATADAVVAHGSTTLPATAVAACGLTVPVVYRSLGDPLYWATTPRRRLQLRVLLRAMTVVVALWPAAAHGLAAELGVRAGRIRVIPNGVDPRRFSPTSVAQRAVARGRLGVAEQRPVVAAVGSLSHEKGVDLLFESAARLDPSPQLILAGEGPRRTALESHARKLGLDVRFLGSVDDVRDVYAAVDCLAVPSRTEGLPAVAIEAGLCGVPVAATDVGGLAEILGHGPLLATPEDPPALAAAIEHALDARNEAGPALRARCQARFTMDAIARLWAEVLFKVARRSPRARARPRS